VAVFVKGTSSHDQILLFLAEHGPMTPTQIIERTGIPERTVRHALRKLKEKEALKYHKSLDDLRYTVYSLAEG